MLRQEILRQEDLGSSGPEKFAQAARQLKKEEQDMRHSGSLHQSPVSTSRQSDFFNLQFLTNSPPTGGDSDDASAIRGKAGPGSFLVGSMRRAGTFFDPSAAPRNFGG
jgi:hypothetical protein